MSSAAHDNAADSSTRPTLLIGTAGHIDHGKSRLVRTLTGHDPDRLPEERARGMTIELGFAHLACDDVDLWFVDVPGHERFIRTMVAGATGIDLALLIVAADDSVMPQTREHAEVLQLLGVRRCLVVLTKLDLVDDEWADAVAEEVADLLRSLGLASLGCIRTSAANGRGIDELRAALAAEARRDAAGRERPRWFRLPIDRSFTIAGRGTVVTGSLLHGAIEPGAELELLPAQTSVRGRELQTDRARRDEVATRTRLAVNLAGVSVEQASRGNELATPGYLEPTRCLTVWIERLAAPGATLRRRQPLRLHLATSEVRCTAEFPVVPGSATFADGYAQLRSERPIVAAWGQRLILRDDAGTRTLGGGSVVECRARPWSARRPLDRETLDVLRSGRPRERVHAALHLAAWEPPKLPGLAARSGCVDADEAQKCLRELVSGGRVVRIGGTIGVAGAVVAQAAEHPARRLAEEAASHPRWAGVPQSAWSGWMPRACPAALRAGLAEWLIEAGHAVLVNGYVLPPGHAGAMSDEDRELLDAIAAELDAAGFQPPAPTALACLAGARQARGVELIDLAIARGDMHWIAEGIVLTAQRWADLRRAAGDLAGQGGFTVSELRQALDSTRKYAVPFAEALDKAGVTKRLGDRRVAASSAKK